MGGGGGGGGSLTNVQSQTACDPGLEGGRQVRGHGQARIAGRPGAAGAVAHGTVLQAGVPAACVMIDERPGPDAERQLLQSC